MPKFNAVYGYLLKPSEGLRSEDEKWGEGQMTLEIDKEPETEEEWQEVAGFIGRHSGYLAVSITHLVPLDDILAFQNNQAATGEETIKGEIVDAE